MGVALIFVTAVLVLSLISPNQGQLTYFLAVWMWRIFGWGSVILPLVMAAGGFYLVLWGMEQAPALPGFRLLGFTLLLLAFEAFATIAFVTWDSNLPDVWSVAQAGQGGGYFGGSLVWLLETAVGLLGTVFVFLVLGIIGAILASGVNREEAGHFLAAVRQRLQRPERPREIPVNSGNMQTGSVTASRTASASSANAATRAEAPAPASKRPSRSRSVPAPVIKEQEADPQQKEEAPPAPRRRTRRSVPASQEESEPLFLPESGNQTWTLPELDELLEPGGEQQVGDALIREQVEIIEHTLESFGAPASVVEINQGPTITQYGVEPSFIEQRSGKRTKVKVGKIAGLADDLTLALAAQSIRIQAPVPGKGYVGIEVPNPEKALVSLRDIMESSDFQQIQSPLRIGLGQDVAGKPIATDLAQMPHLLIAGTTGSGKSVCVNSIVASLLLQNTPDKLKLVMVDPKRVELTGYNGIPHLIAPVVVDLERVVGTLQWALREMDKRYKHLAETGARNIVEYNKKAADNGHEPMPYIVIVIDELADLMMLSPEETERSITRLAQMARATGIHMVIATQRPSVDVVTGLIKANFPARVAFAVASSTDSRVILDSTGAERLLGQGDMLFQSPDAAAPLRMQGAFVSEPELRRIIDYWRTARRQARAESGAPEATAAAEATVADDSGANGAAAAEQSPAAEPLTQPPLWEEMREAEEEAAKYADELLPDAIALVRDLGKASTSLLQRRFRIGYTRAARMMDVMEEDGIIGPPTGTSKARKVLPWRDEEEPAESEQADAN
ncbi:MAG: DNA translocase FtsK [Candidatus Promineifilaceae bacterium]|nr:DNA translocase FtsK [Candidatus Promineifilaceae bacterium]